MKNFLKNLTFLLLSTFIALGTACSGGGGGGGSSAPGNATITTDNVEALATAGTEGTKQAVSSNNVSPFAKLGTGEETPIQSMTVSLAQIAAQDPKLADINAFCDSGGGHTNIDENTGNGTITYTNCTFGNGVGAVTVNGTATISSTTSGNITTFSIKYENFTISTADTTETIDFEATCTINNDTGDISCDYKSEALGIDGRTYSVSNVSVSGDASSGYTVGCVVTDPDNGIITVTTTTPITFNCPNGQPDNGQIVISDNSGNTANITFIDCSSYSVDFNGTTTTFTW